MVSHLGTLALSLLGLAVAVILHPTTASSRSHHSSSLLLKPKSNIIPADGGKQLQLPFLKQNVKLDKKQHACGEPAADCAEVYRRGHRDSGIYTIKSKNQQGTLDVYCDMDTNGGGWTVFQRRASSLKLRNKESFFRTWAEYARGFGDLEREFWLGNENLFALTSNDRMRLRVDLQDYAGERRYQLYDEFRVGSETWGYNLMYLNSSGTAGDGLTHSRNQMFSTYDHDKDKSEGQCALALGSGGWFGNCTRANVNGLYFEHEATNPQGVTWATWRGDRTLQFVEMKFRPVSFRP